MMSLKGKTAVITGGATGIGLASAKRFIQEGQKASGAMTPLRRMAYSSEIAAAAAFLASTDSSILTASEVAGDSGLAQL